MRCNYIIFYIFYIYVLSFICIDYNVFPNIPVFLLERAVFDCCVVLCPLFQKVDPVAGVLTIRASQSRTRKLRKTSKMVAVVVLLFATFWLPIHVFQVSRHTTRYFMYLIWATVRLDIGVVRFIDHSHKINHPQEHSF